MSSHATDLAVYAKSSYLSSRLLVPRPTGRCSHQPDHTATCAVYRRSGLDTGSVSAADSSAHATPPHQMTTMLLMLTHGQTLHHHQNHHRHHHRNRFLGGIFMFFFLMTASSQCSPQTLLYSAASFRYQCSCYFQWRSQEFATGGV